MSAFGSKADTEVNGLYCRERKADRYILFRGLEHGRSHNAVLGATQPNVDLQNNQ
jgi:hypothetical protein